MMDAFEAFEKYEKELFPEKPVQNDEALFEIDEEPKSKPAEAPSIEAPTIDVEELTKQITEKILAQLNAGNDTGEGGE